MSRMIVARTLDEALEALAKGNARILAGGTDLMIALRADRQLGRELPETIVDVTRLVELNRLDLGAPEPFLGAGVTFHTLETHPTVAAAYPLLASAASTVGSKQIRRSGTIGGNAANGSPAADGVAALCALNAVALLASPGGQRRCPIGELIVAPYKTTLAPDEILVGFYLDRLPGEDSQVFAKVGRRQAVAVSRMNLAVCLDRGLARPRVVLGACFPTPRRLQEVEELISGGKPGEELWRAAGERAAQEFVNVCGWRSSANYKVPAVKAMMAHALEDAWSALA